MLEYLHLQGWHSPTLLPTATRYFANTIMLSRLQRLSSPQLATSSYHTLRLDTDGRLYACGDNSFGQLGLPDLGHIATTFTLVPTLEPVVMVAVGQDHSFYVTVSGDLYACGCGDHRRLGLEVNLVTTFQLVPTPGPVQSVAAGDYHSLVLLKSGEVYGCGSNYYEQLGLQETTGDCYHLLTLVPTDNKMVLEVMAAESHSALVTTDGLLYACGENKHHQFTLVPTPEPVCIAVIGNYHSTFLSLTGSLYACGNNDYGQLGQVDTSSQLQYKLIPVSEAVCDVAIGLYHTLFLTVSGCLYACGCNENGQAGPLSDAAYGDIIRVSVLGPVSAVTAANWHSFVTLVDGSLYACGSNRGGQLGLGTSCCYNDLMLVPR